MKKLLIALAVLLAIVLGSPAVIGSMAENAMQQNLGWAAGQAGTGELNVSAEEFNKGWFSSTGRYRVEIGEGQLQNTMLDAFNESESDELPYLLVDTTLDHGVIPLSTMKPGLGSAESTISIVAPDGEVFNVPGVIYSDIGFGGGVDSVYELAAGSHDFGDGVIEWQDTRVSVSNSLATGQLLVDASMEGITVSGTDGNFVIGGVSIVSDQAPSEAGFLVGTADIRVDTVEVSEPNKPTMTAGPITVKSTSSANGELVDADTQLSMSMSELPMIGSMLIEMDIALTGVHGVAAENIGEALGQVDDNADPGALYGLVEADLMTLFENGFVVDFREFDVELDMGRTDTSMKVTVPAMQPGFTWADVLRGMTAEAKMSVPVALMDMVTAMNPQAGAPIAMGYMSRNGDFYETEAQYAQGLMTINGAPVPLPIPGN